MDESKTSEGGERVGNLAEPMEGVEGGTTSEDVMVEVLGSDVFVDGIRSHEDDDAVVSEDDGSGDNNKTTDDMDIDSKLPNDSSQPLGGGETKDTDLVKNVGSSETEEVNREEKEIPDEEGGIVAKASIIVVEETQLIVVEETQLIDDDGGFVEETQVVVEEKNLIEETIELENPLEGDDRGKTDVLGETVVDASSGGPVESSRPTGGSSNPLQEQDGSESAAADTIVATLEQDTQLTTKLVPNQEEEEKNANVENGVECHPSLVLETSTQLGEDNLNSRRDSDGVSPIPEESAAAMQSRGRHADAEGEVKKIKEDTEGSSEVAVDETQTEDKPRVEGAPGHVEKVDDGGILAADSEQPTQIVVAGKKTEEVDEETVSSTCPIDQDSNPEEGHRDSKMDDSAEDVEAASLTGQMTEANMEVVTGPSEKVEQAQEAIEQEEEEPVNHIESEKARPRINDNHQEVEGGSVTTIPDQREVLKTALAKPVVVGLEDDKINDHVVVNPSQLSQPTAEIELGEQLEEDIANADSHLAPSEHILCERTEMDVQVTEHGECVLTVNEVVLGSSSNNDIEVVVVDNNTEYMNGSLTVNFPINVDREQQPATDTDEKQLAAESDMADIDETQLDTVPNEEEQEVHGEEHVTADYDEQNDEKTETSFASYNLPQEKEDDFAVSDLVWGKVRSHPWWPGQIFDPSAASEAALKYHKKEDSYLVAYFGDRTFAWMNETSGLKPLRNHFSQLEKQSSSEAFRNAVDCALEEVSRRARLSLTCSCISQDEKINFQIVENDGIKDELCKREGLGDANTATTFEPDKLFEYVKELAQIPYCGADRYELAVAKAQLLSFYRLKGGFSQLPEFQDGGELVEGDTGNLNFDELSADDDDEEYSSGGGHEEEEEENKPPQKRSLKRKHNLRDITYPIKKGRSMKELMSETTSNNDDDQRSTKVVMNAATTAAPPVPKPSFKIGECISRVASQLTGSSSLLKQQHADPEVASTNDKEASLHDLLSRLHVAAQEPLKEHTNDNGNCSFGVIRSFFSDFRNSAVLEQNPELSKTGGGGGGTKRKRPSHLDDGSTEAFEFEDMNDSYWTDRVIENGVEEELLPSDGCGAITVTSAKKLENHVVPVELKPLKTGRRPYNKRRHLETTATHGNNNGLGFAIADKPDYIDPNAPAELVMVFAEFGFFPATEVSLNRMFKRFGPLRESQTELDRDTCRARVVFKKCSDAEVACSSAGRFSIFGPVHVIYQVNYSVSPEFKTIGAMIEDGGEHHEEDYIE